jgi:hypothetical protein
MARDQSSNSTPEAGSAGVVVSGIGVSLALEKERIVPLLKAKYLGCVTDAVPDTDVTDLELL